jgi:Animal haem peroxidase
MQSVDSIAVYWVPIVRRDVVPGACERLRGTPAGYDNPCDSIINSRWNHSSHEHCFSRVESHSSIAERSFMHGLNYSQLRKQRCGPSAPAEANVHSFSFRSGEVGSSLEMELSALDEGAEDAGGNFKGMRNLLPISNPEDRFGFKHATTDPDGLIARLAHRMKRGQRQVDPNDASTWSYWPDKLPGAAKREDNPAMPSGYTYLLQLIAHDILASSLSFAVSKGELAVENTRLQPMLLGTIYGGGPDVNPSAYEFSSLVRDSRGRVPRTRLRTGRIRHTGGGACPFDDIGRARGVDVSDTGLCDNPERLTEALIADPRNDDHALISQTALLFHRLHNDVIQFVDTAQPVNKNGDHAYANYLCARAVVTLIYRHIILRDVLKQLLHPRVYTHYVTNRGALVSPQDGGRVPLEFAVGAFRCGHAMLREAYQVNSERPLKLDRGLDQSTLRNPDAVPVTQAWVVEWKRFFQIDGTTPNFSRRLGPNFAGVAHNQSVFPRLDGSDVDGLPVRDLISAVHSGLWSVPSLIERLRQNPDLAAILPDYRKFEIPLKSWLEEPAVAGAVPFLPGDVADLVADPPLPFFILFEAACTPGDRLEDSGDHFQKFTGGGQHLGPLGSIIIAESIIGLLRATDLSERDGDGIFDPLPHQIDYTTNRFGLGAGMFSAFHAVSSMSDLIKVMLARNIIKQ